MHRFSRSEPRESALAPYIAYCPAGTPLDDLIRVAGSRWAVEECFQSAKQGCGLDDYQVRRYPGKHARRAHPAPVTLAPTTPAPGPYQSLQTTRTQPLTWPPVTANTVAVPAAAAAHRVLSPR
ncbi:hypothetical protein SHO565_52850 [Streptomyces sp. HO565]